MSTALQNGLHVIGAGGAGRGGGRRRSAGSKGATLREDDSMGEVLHVMAHDSIVFFTQDGLARSIKAFQIPKASRTAAGSAITQVRLPAADTLPLC